MTEPKPPATADAPEAPALPAVAALPFNQPAE